MDLFTLVGTIWRHRLATIPVILITLIGAGYVLEVKPPTYQSSAEILLANPPNPPTQAQIAADPALGKVNWNNPYLGYGNLVLVADVVIELVGSPAVQQELVNKGADPKYTVALENAFENPPVIQATGVGPSPAAAIKSAQLVAAQVIQSLYQIQAEQHVDRPAMITGAEFVKPSVATSSSSGKLRTLIGFFALGLILLLLAVSIAQAMENRGIGRKRKPKPVGPADDSQREYSPGARDFADEEQRDSRPGPVRMADNGPPDGPARVHGAPARVYGAGPLHAPAGRQGRRQ